MGDEDMENVDEAREKLKHILAKDEYQIYHEDNRNILQIWWDNAKDWLMEQLSKLSINFQPSSGMASVILIGIIIVVIALIGLVIFFVVRNSRRKQALHDYQPLTSTNEMNWTFHHHLTKAQEEEKKQNYATAARHMFLALLLYFHDKGWLEARVWKTNWEYYAELRKVNQQSADHFYNLALLFDEVVYGERVMQKDEYISYRDEAMTWLNKDAAENTSEG